METASRAILLVLFLIAFGNYKRGTLPDWLRAKFFNSAAPKPEGRSAGLDGLDFGGIGRDSVVLTGLGGGSGRMVAPVSGGLVTSRFGDRRPTGRHAGVDWAVPTGTPVAAARAGRVTFAGAAGSYGLRVDIDHGEGVVTRYAHLSRLGVGVTDLVRAGQTIGASGNTGRSSGPHLHFEVRVRGTAVDPMSFVGPSAQVVTA